MLEIDFLQTLANEEIADISLYRKESSDFAKKIVSGKKIASVFEALALEEEMHLKALSEISGKNIKFNLRQIKTYSSLRKTLYVHAKREAESVKLYKQAAQKCEKELKRKILYALAEQEAKHLRIINNYLFLLGGKR